MEKTLRIKPMMGATKSRSTKKEPIFGANPMARKLSKINECSENHVTFRGISNKCIFFMMTLLMGVLIALLLQRVGAKVTIGTVDVKSVRLALSELSVAGAVGMGISAIMLLVVQCVAFFMKKAAAVTGTIYCVSAGYVFTYMTMIIEEYRAAVAIALFITVAVCMAMFLLYRSGQITVTKKFSTVIIILIAADILGGLALLVCRFIPGLSFISTFVYSNGVVTMLGAIIGVVIASLLLLVDFDAVTKCVEDRVPVENEWYCAFCLAFSVIWLFMKVLDLVLKVMSKGNK